MTAGGLGITIVSALLAVAVFYFFRKRSKRSELPDMSHVTYTGAIRAMIEGAYPGAEDIIPNLPRNVPDSALADAAVEETQRDTLSLGIFRAYDIRGVVGKTLTPEAVYIIGRAVGSIAHDRGQQRIVVGRDGRESSPDLAQSLIKGLCASGRDVIDIGMVPTPVLYFATHYLETASGIMVTGSHNAPEYNGLKIMLDGDTLFGDAIRAIYQRASKEEFTVGQGTIKSNSIADSYIRRVTEDIATSPVRPQKIVVDAGNGVAGPMALDLFRALGHEVVELYCDVDGSFPHHQPDPSQPDNLRALIDKVKQQQADIGFAFDGDGDRLGVIDAAGNIIWPDRQLMLLAKDLLANNPGAVIIYDVKCSRHLKAIIEAGGGQPLMWKTGHSFIKNKMKQENALLAGEMSGHIFFKERWYGFDDALYAAARILAIIGATGKGSTELFSALPDSVSTPELRMQLAEEQHADFMAAWRQKMSFDNANIIDIDGFRIEFADGWGLIRPSNTTSHVIIRFEADNESALERIKSEFRNLIQSIDPGLEVPF